MDLVHKHLVDFTVPVDLLRRRAPETAALSHIGFGCVVLRQALLLIASKTCLLITPITGLLSASITGLLITPITGLLIASKTGLLIAPITGLVATVLVLVVTIEVGLAQCSRHVGCMADKIGSVDDVVGSLADVIGSVDDDDLLVEIALLLFAKLCIFCLVFADLLLDILRFVKNIVKVLAVLG